ncbi:MAG: glycosyltransferase [Chlorobi bacterium]|nr:glycosyltransferase [Chlorobiota bacterium]
MKNKILLMLPAYNEEDSLPQLLKRIVKTYDNFDLNGEILIINDGSKDKTLELAQNFKTDYKKHILDIQPNKGLSNAMREGFNKALSLITEDDVLIVMDADDSHNPGLIPLMLQKNAEGADIVIASRYREGSRIKGLSKFRKFMSWGAGLLYRVFIHIEKVKDYTCGYRAYNPKLLTKAIENYKDKFIEEQGFAGMAEILLKLKKYKPIIVEVPFILRYDRKESKSKMNVGNTVKQSLKMIAKHAFK